ncbi:MAG: iron-sulfur cluster assembly accessory protein [Pseudomonadota bacterium]
MDLSLPVTVSPRAFARLAEIAAAEGGSPKALRVAVLGGGCSGFQYEFVLEDTPGSDDLVLEGPADSGGQKVLIDPESLPFLEGSVIDFKDELIGARFAVENPNATSTCGCGTSFAI